MIIAQASLPVQMGCLTPGELRSEKLCAREFTFTEGHWEPFSLFCVYYCYRRRKSVAPCEYKLIGRAAHGDQEAFRHLLRAHHAAAIAAALRLCHLPAPAAKLTRGAFLLDSL